MMLDNQSLEGKQLVNIFQIISLCRGWRDVFQTGCQLTPVWIAEEVEWIAWYAECTENLPNLEAAHTNLSCSTLCGILIFIIALRTSEGKRFCSKGISQRWELPWKRSATLEILCGQSGGLGGLYSTKEGTQGSINISSLELDPNWKQVFCLITGLLHQIPCMTHEAFFGQFSSPSKSRPRR